MKHKYEKPMLIGLSLDSAHLGVCVAGTLPAGQVCGIGAQVDTGKCAPGYGANGAGQGSGCQQGYGAPYRCRIGSGYGASVCNPGAAITSGYCESGTAAAACNAGSGVV